MSGNDRYVRTVSLWQKIIAMSTTLPEAMYEGETNNGIREGKGILKFSVAKGKYIGMFQNGFRHGWGEYTTFGGRRTYEGEWKQGRRHGQGHEKWKSREGVVYAEYEGQYQDDQFHGQGVYRHFGSKYTGAFVQGRKQGSGEMEYANGDSYDGEWYNDLRCGRGKYIRKANGYIFDCEWVDGLKQGPGIEMQPKGYVFEGNWIDNLKQGSGIMKLPTGKQRGGEWSNDKRIGWTTPEMFPTC